jgi:hypothetical protein
MPERRVSPTNAPVYMPSPSRAQTQLSATMPTFGRPKNMMNRTARSGTFRKSWV